MAILIALGTGTSAAFIIALLDFRLGVPLQQGLPLIGVCLLACLIVVIALPFRSRAAGSISGTPRPATSSARPAVSVRAVILVRSRMVVNTPISKKAVGA